MRSGGQLCGSVVVRLAGSFRNPGPRGSPRAHELPNRDGADLTPVSRCDAQPWLHFLTLAAIGLGLLDARQQPVPESTRRERASQGADQRLLELESNINRPSGERSPTIGCRDYPWV